jgi:hypothetical protein
MKKVLTWEDAMAVCCFARFECSPSPGIDSGAKDADGATSWKALRRARD